MMVRMKKIEIAFIVLLIPFEVSKVIYMFNEVIGKYYFKSFVIYNTVVTLLFILFFLMVIIKQHIKKSKYEKFDIYRQVDFKDISYLSAGKLLNIKTLPINTILIVIYTLIDKGIIKVVYKDEKPYIC